MNLDTFKPTFLIEIEGRSLSKGITKESESFTFADNEVEYAHDWTANRVAHLRHGTRHPPITQE